VDSPTPLTLRIVSLSCVVVAWLALVVAFFGALFTPQNYCYYESLPTPTLVVVMGLIVAGIALVSAIVAAVPLDLTMREAVLAVGLVTMTLFAGVGVLVLMQHHTASWGCG